MAKSKIFDDHYNQYENWFEVNKAAYQSEIKTLEALIPANASGLEIGVGSGLFAQPLGIKEGVDPSVSMLKLARERGIRTRHGTAENLPYENNAFDFVLLVTSICFLDDVDKSLKECYRVLKSAGQIIIGYVDRESEIGKTYEKHKEKSLFYREAHFFSTDELITYLKKHGFGNFEFRQTLFRSLNEIHSPEPVKTGYGEGSFVALKAQKSQK